MSPVVFWAILIIRRAIFPIRHSCARRTFARALAIVFLFAVIPQPWTVVGIYVGQSSLGTGRMSQKGGVNLRISDGRWPVDRTVCLHETLRECIDIACFSCMIWCNKKGVSSTGILAFTYKSLREHLGKHFRYWMERKMKA